MKPELKARLQTSQYFKSSSNMEVGETVIGYANYWRSKPITEGEKSRTEMTLKAIDCNELPKVEGAGDIFLHDGYLVQRMHEGTIVHADAYCGMWTTKLINKARGHHEPQEEKVFAKILESLHEPHLMLEFGAWWSFYSLWFQRKFPGATTLLVEPDPLNLAIGASNYQMSGVKGWFANAAVGCEPVPISMDFYCDSDQQIRRVPKLSVDFIATHLQLETPIDIVLIDVQGAEFDALEGMRSSIARGLIKFVVVSTHSQTISGDYRTHENCLQLLKQMGAHIVAEHTVEESYSGDGLIVAQFGREALVDVAISYNRTKNSLFGSSEDKMAVLAKELEATRTTVLQSFQEENEKLKTEILRLQEAELLRQEREILRLQEQEARFANHDNLQAKTAALLHRLSFRIGSVKNGSLKTSLQNDDASQREVERSKAALEEARRKHYGKKKLKLTEKEPKQNGPKKWIKSLIRPQGAVNKAIFRCLFSIIRWQSETKRQLLAMQQQQLEMVKLVDHTRKLLAASLSPVDSQWYLNRYPDIKKAGVDPSEHFHLHGWMEGRDPNENFDVKWYLRQYPDVKAAGVNPLAHYHLWGHEEGRKPKPNPLREVEQGGDATTRSSLERAVLRQLLD